MSMEHSLEGHYRAIVLGIDRRTIGVPHHVRWAELALLTLVDRCEPCFDKVRDMITAEPLALIASRRFNAIVMGLQQLVGGRGSADEVAEIEAIEAMDAETVRWLFIENTQLTAQHLAAAHAGHGKRPERPRRRKPVRRPNQRVRTKEERDAEEQ